MAKASKSSVKTPEPEAAKPAFKIESVTREARYLKFMVYGDFGSGKTYLMASAVDIPKMNDILLIDAESGDLTLDSDDYDFDKVSRVSVTSFSQLSKVYDYLKIHCELRDDPSDEAIKKLLYYEEALRGESVKGEPKRYRTVIVDSLSEVEAYCMNQLLGIQDDTKLDEEAASAEWSEYKKQNSMILRLVRNFRNLPMHVLMSCSRQYVQNENKRFIYSPGLTGKLGSKVQGFMDLVGFLVLQKPESEESEMKRKLYVHPVGNFDAKCRFSSYRKSYFDSPTMGTILKQVGLTK